MAPPRIRFARQVLALQIGVVTLVVGVGFALVGWLLDKELTQQYGERALAVAHSLAADPAIGRAAALDDPEHVIQPRAEQVRGATGALFVVVTDRDGIRLAHPNPNLIGAVVSTDPSAALSGREVINVERGTLGLSARGKVPLHEGGRDGGRIVGEVSVGFAADDIRAHVMHRLGFSGVFAGGALLLGVAGSALLTRRLKRLTLGLEPHELAELVQEREAVLHGIGEGVLAVDTAGQVTVCNDEAQRLLGVPLIPGTPVAELDLPPRLLSALTDSAPTDEGATDNLITVAGDRVLVANQREVRHSGRNLGRVLTLRDRTDLETLTRELDAVRTLTDALRAQRHEFANRLHTIAGLLQTDHHTEALEYLHALSGPMVPASPGSFMDGVQDAYLQAFLGAKTAEAEEKGVRLEVSDTSWVPTGVVTPVQVTTVAGNLIDNALEAARLGGRRPARVEVVLLAEGTTLHMSVADTGDGVPTGLRDQIFAEGVSTRDGEGRGLGLALTRQAARSLGGGVTLADPGGPEQGAIFAVRLPGALSATFSTVEG
jgi:two-component system CitB family sensor kinase